MTAIQLNNLWSYIQGMSLKKKDREWLASKLLEPVDDAKTAQQKAFVKESLYRALDEVEQAKSEGRQLKTLDEFLDELEKVIAIPRTDGRLPIQRARPALPMVSF